MNKPKLNLKNADQNWCVMSNDSRLIGYLNNRYDRDFGGHASFYGISENKVRWSNGVFAPIYTLAEFLTALDEYNDPEWQPKCGELVEVSNNNSYWAKGFYIATFGGKYIITDPLSAGNDVHFANGRSFKCSEPYKHIRQIKQPVIKLTIDGVDVDINTLSDSEFLALKNGKK